MRKRHSHLCINWSSSACFGVYAHLRAHAQNQTSRLFPSTVPRYVFSRQSHNATALHMICSDRCRQLLLAILSRCCIISSVGYFRTENSTGSLLPRLFVFRSSCSSPFDSSKPSSHPLHAIECSTPHGNSLYSNRLAIFQCLGQAHYSCTIKLTFLFSGERQKIPPAPLSATKHIYLACTWWCLLNAAPTSFIDIKWFGKRKLHDDYRSNQRSETALCLFLRRMHCSMAHRRSHSTHSHVNIMRIASDAGTASVSKWPRWPPHNFVYVIFIVHAGRVSVFVHFHFAPVPLVAHHFWTVRLGGLQMKYNGRGKSTNSAITMTSFRFCFGKQNHNHAGFLYSWKSRHFCMLCCTRVILTETGWMNSKVHRKSMEMGKSCTAQFLLFLCCDATVSVSVASGLFLVE